METEVQAVRAQLFGLQDETYRDFQSALMPTVPKEKVIGVRTPALRKLAKQLAKVRKDGTLPYLRPDGKTQVTVEFDEQGNVVGIDTVVVSKERKNYDFFPLTVDFNEKMYAAGRIPGGYLKREGRPSEKATLTARMIDRPIRPSFPDGFRNEVHIVATSLVADQVNPVDTICVMAASAALTVGGVPFEGPLACVRIGRNVETGEFIVNPTYEERENSDLDLELGGSADFISMVEAGAEEISEDDMLAAMKFGQEALAAFCQAQDEFVAEWEQVNGPIVKKEYPLDQPVEEVQERIFAHYDEMAAALRDADKLSRIGKVEALKESIRAEFTDEELAELAMMASVDDADAQPESEPEPKRKKHFWEKWW